MLNMKFLKKALQLRLREMVQGTSGLESLNRLFKTSGIEGLDDYMVIISTGCMALESARKIIDKPGYSELDRHRACGSTASAYSRYGEAFVAAYKGLGVMIGFLRKNKADVLDIEAKVKGALSKTQRTQSFKEYLELSRVEAVRGESRISIEEKELLQLIVYGNIYSNLLPDEEAIQVIEAGINVICSGYIVECIDGTYLDRYAVTQKKFIPMYRNAMRKIMEGAKFR